MRRSTKLLLATGCLGAVAAATFAWGFQAHRRHWFPYQYLKLATTVDAQDRTTRSDQRTEDRREAFPSRTEEASILSLPYIDGMADPQLAQAGVLMWDEEDAWVGLNLYSTRLHDTVYLLDMRGREIHRWSYTAAGRIQLAVPLRNGDLIGIEKDRKIFRIDRDANEIWRLEERFHHALEIDHDGNIWSLTREDRAGLPYHPDYEIIEDFIRVLSPDGEPMQKISLLEILERSPYANLIPTVWHLSLPLEDSGNEPVLDLIHPNHVEVFDGSLAGESPLYRRGNILVSLRNMSSIAIVDGETLEVLWLWGPGYLFAQHHSTLLESGNILVFNNGVERSSILEIDPRTRRVVWEYAPKEGFFARKMGSCQRLPNGNTLITDSPRGYAFEVTPDGETVWRFANPDREGDLRLSVYRFARYPVEYFEFLKRE